MLYKHIIHWVNHCRYRKKAEAAKEPDSGPEKDTVCMKEVEQEPELEHTAGMKEAELEPTVMEEKEPTGPDQDPAMMVEEKGATGAEKLNIAAQRVCLSKEPS